jgi:hypothetical protein
LNESKSILRASAEAQIIHKLAIVLSHSGPCRADSAENAGVNGQRVSLLEAAEEWLRAAICLVCR